MSFTPTYSPPPPQNPADVIRADTCDTRRYLPVPPLKGLRGTRTVTLFYRALSPDGDGWSGSLKALSGWETVPTAPPPFRRTPHRPWLRLTTTVRRNLKRHPQLFRVNPLAGIMSTHRNVPNYRYSSPNGDNLLFGITGSPSDLPHLSVHCSLLTVHSSYTFSAKEKDSETGLSYFGSRYYSSDLSIWLSVDPMSDKYPSLSPYAYCADNPVRVVDPNGEEIVIEGKDGSFIYTPGSECKSSDWKVKAAWSNLDKMYQNDAGKDVISEMCGENAPKYVITDKKGVYDNAANFSPDGNKGGTLYMNGEIENIQSLSHELFHGYQYMKDQGGLSCHNEVEAQLFSFLVCGKETLAPRSESVSSDYFNSYLNLINNTFSSSDDFPKLRNGFLLCSTANAPSNGKKDGLYSSLKTPLGENNVFLLSKYFK